ncbi:MAG: redox-regulated ATPase YchF [Armatimonadota bacterium]|nr:redox-regulated ATPase YchF [Armatimonadota bacterium]MDR7436326.1 redox-regulated ATPase YchF [Armatimonadota bacterium]MDR7508117.1 redox-regulated ATPase YchF [Armatimonadota bacterium]MDR7582407.1 redox-regulated ATPase YchF [Armatimonadota bacterium]
MGLSVGLVGLPNAGKSSLFVALTRAAVAVAPYPFTTVEPHRGVVPVPDPRLEAIAAVTRPARVVPATVEVVDIAGLVRGAHRGEGLGNQFLAHIRDVDALAHVVRCFAAPDVPHVDGAPDPRRDLEVVDLELALADLATVEREWERVRSRARLRDPAAGAAAEVLEQVRDALQRGVPIRRLPPDPRRDEVLRPLRLLTAKPVVYVANVADDDLPDAPSADPVRRYAQEQEAPVVVLSARLEMEAAALAADEAAQVLAAYGVTEPGLQQLVRVAYRLLGLVTFFTTASHEVRAWPVPAGTTAPQAAGRIHSDMERGFIRAEVVGWDELVAAGSLPAARERGLVRLEGRSYVVRDGDVILFRFAV